MERVIADKEDVLLGALKQLILTACNRPESPDTIDEDAPLIGPSSALGLDSLDVLQVSLALTQQYHVRLEDSKEARRALRSIRSLGLFLRAAGVT
ncbi:MAG: phosphopantetheine-binding protein [Acidiferrobacter sp.]